ncbi:hypothetical protein M8C21_005534 [Ambrosia artemisiifolia]|uniref:Uncharacterized protein n=1 Tax=Ambrosia artemisiifolia TaxID=4212 RepID=A0AAD5CPQ6_AMBAR|nr:hypothetical protein M8C21_005534 [Ambrosia artemisiifolia]
MQTKRLAFIPPLRFRLPKENIYNSEPPFMVIFRKSPFCLNELFCSLVTMRLFAPSSLNCKST